MGKKKSLAEAQEDSEGVVLVRVADSFRGISLTHRDSPLYKFKQRLADVMRPEYTDHYFMKWLKARNDNIDKAEVMFRESLAYKKRMDLENLKQNYKIPEVIRKYMPGGFAGFDKEGSPIRIEQFGNLDFKGMIYSCRKVDIERSKLLLGEEIMDLLDKQTKKMRCHVDGMTVILDMTNTSTSMLWGPALQMIVQMGKVVQDNYPEVVKRSFIVNAPGIFPLLWRMIRPLLTEEMKQKVCVLGSNYKQELLRHIDASQLPAFLGGTLKDKNGDPQCSAMICQGGTIPESYYLEELINLDQLTSVTVAAGGKKTIEVDVASPNSLLRYEFRTDDMDIAFGIVYLPPDGPAEDLIKCDRVTSHVIPEDGAVMCRKSGKYEVIFDNSYSWTRSKTVHYRVEVTAEEEKVAVVNELNQLSRDKHWSISSHSQVKENDDGTKL